MDKRKFSTAWFDAFTESRPRALFDIALTLASIGGNIIVWAKGTTTTQVIGMMALLLVVVLWIAWSHAAHVWNGEANRANQAEADLARERARRPRPSLMVTYESPRLASFQDDIPDVPVGVHNTAGVPMVNLRFEPLSLFDGCVFEIQDIPFIGPLAATNARMQARRRDEDGDERLERNVNIGNLLRRALMHALMPPVVEGNPRWTLSGHYSDTEGNAYTSDFEIEINRELMIAFARLKQHQGE